MELMIAVAVVGILAAAAIPISSGMMNRIEVSSGVTHLLSIMRLAQTKATANPRVHYGVYLDPATLNRALIFEDSNGNRQYDDGVDEIFRPYYTLANGTAVQFTGVVNNKILFRGDGSAEDGGDLDVVRGGAKRRLSVDAPTGKVVVQ